MGVHVRRGDERHEHQVHFAAAEPRNSGEGNGHPLAVSGKRRFDVQRELPQCRRPREAAAADMHEPDLHGQRQRDDHHISALVSQLLGHRCHLRLQHHDRHRAPERHDHSLHELSRPRAWSCAPRRRRERHTVLPRQRDQLQPERELRPDFHRKCLLLRRARPRHAFLVRMELPFRWLEHGRQALRVSLRFA